MSELPIQVTSLLDKMSEFGGHNGFLNSEDKEEAIQCLRILARLPDPPPADAIEDYLYSHPKVSRTHKGAGRARKWYEEIIAKGKRHRLGASQRPISDPPLVWDPERQIWHLPGR